MLVPNGGDAQKSVPLLILVFLSGVVGAVSMVGVFPFASLYGGVMIGALSAGSGANALFPSILALGQGASEPQQRFSVQIFFLIIAGLIGLTLCCFAWLALHSLPKTFLNVRSLAAPSGLETRSLLDSAAELQNSRESDSLLQSLRPIFGPLVHECYISLLQYILLGCIPYAFNGYGDLNRTFLFWNTFVPISVGAVGRLVTIKIKLTMLLPQSIGQVRANRISSFVSLLIP